MEAHAEDTHELVPKRVEMALIKYDPQTTMMDVRLNRIGDCGSTKTREMRRDKRLKNKGSA